MEGEDPPKCTTDTRDLCRLCAPLLNKGLGVRGATPVAETAMRPGVSYLQDITIASYSMGEPGTILQSSKTTVYIDSGSRMLLLAQ